jgi:hypothetical protein
VGGTVLAETVAEGTRGDARELPVLVAGHLATHLG